MDISAERIKKMVNLSPNIKSILDSEWAFGNKIVSVTDSDHFRTDTLITLEYKFDCPAIMSINSNKIEFGINKDNQQHDLRFYKCKETGHVIQDSDKERPITLKNLSPNLKPILDLELSLGNEILAAYPNDWYRAPLRVDLKYKFHEQEIKEKIDLTNIEKVIDTTSGYKTDSEFKYYRCKETYHILSDGIEKPTMTEEEMMRAHIKDIFNEQ